MIFYDIEKIKKELNIRKKKIAQKNITEEEKEYWSEEIADLENMLEKMVKVGLVFFRGKRKDNKKWVYGDLIYHGRDEISIGTEGFINSLEAPYEVIPETVGQLVGMADDNNPYYVGDIVELYNNDICVIERRGNSFVAKKLYTKDDNKTNVKEYQYPMQNNNFYTIKCEKHICVVHIIYNKNGEILSVEYIYYIPRRVLGNKWDNPELLKDKNNER